jgi:hypothetical protein
MVTADNDEDSRLIRRDVDDTRFVRRGGGDTRLVHDDNEQTRVVDRHSVENTRVVESALDAAGQPVIPEADDEATRLRARTTDAACTTDAAGVTDPDRTQLSTRQPGGRPRQAAVLAVPTAPTDSTVVGFPVGVPAGFPSSIPRPPDAPVGSTTSYGIRSPGPAAAPIHRVDLSAGIPRIARPATPEQIRRVGGAHERRRSLVAISVIMLVTAVVAGVATIAIIVIAGM